MTAADLWKKWQELETGRYDGHKCLDQRARYINLSGFMREFRALLREAAEKEKTC